MIARSLNPARFRSRAREDANFDGFADRFDSMYDTSWGQLRLAVLWDHMLEAMPELADGGLRVLDAGGGAGRIALKLAELGHDVVLSDPSRAMLARAETSISEAGLADAISVVHAPIQEIGLTEGPFDAIACHAVLEWVAEPQAALERLVHQLKPGGHLSLMFSNRYGWLLKRLAQGDLDAAEVPGVHTPGKERSLAWLRRRFAEPSPAPLDEQNVRSWLAELTCTVEAKAGIRIFHDYVRPESRSPDWLEQLLTVEKAYRSIEPYASLGQQTHLVCRRGPAASSQP
jgi:tRNA 5-carboxymethoxyuridine methyltransferase